MLSEMQRLKLFDLEPGEVEALKARLRARFPSRADYDAFARIIELTDEEIGAILARELRVARYLDNRLKLAAQLRDSELQEASRGRKLSEEDLATLRAQLAQEKYQRLLRELLADLRETVARTRETIAQSRELIADPLPRQFPLATGCRFRIAGRRPRSRFSR